MLYQMSNEAFVEPVAFELGKQIQAIFHVSHHLFGNFLKLEEHGHIEFSFPHLEFILIP